MNNTGKKSSSFKLQAIEFLPIKDLRTSESYIEGYTIYTLNIRFGWYKWPHDTFDECFTRGHLAVAMINPDKRKPISAGAR